MSDVGCDTQVRRQLSPGATFGSLQSYVCRSGPVAAFTQSPAALTPPDKQQTQTNSLNNHFSVLLSCSVVLQNPCY